jgi:hypothetical protein
MKKGMVWVIAVCIVSSILITLWILRTHKAQKAETLKNYIATEATIIQVQPARMTSYGVKPARNSIRFKGLNGETYTQYNCTLTGNWKMNEKVTVYYNPQNLQDPVIDRNE